MLCLDRHAVVGTCAGERGVQPLESRFTFRSFMVNLTGPPNFMFFDGKGKGTGLNRVVRRSVKLLSARHLDR